MYFCSVYYILTGTFAMVFQQDTLNEVQKLSNFLELKTDISLLQQICDKCDFSKLRDGYEKSKTLFSESHNPLNYTFRKGKTF